MPWDPHSYVEHINPRYPNSCGRCGRTREWHEDNFRPTALSQTAVTAAPRVVIDPITRHHNLVS